MTYLTEKAAIEQAVLCLFLAIDADEPQRVADCFTEDGVWHRRNGERVGRAAIIDEMHSRPRGRRIQHLVSNLIIMDGNAGRAEVVFKTLAFADDHPEAGRASPLTLPIALDAYSAALANAQGVWRVSRLMSDRLFAL